MGQKVQSSRNGNGHAVHRGHAHLQQGADTPDLAQALFAERLGRLRSVAAPPLHDSLELLRGALQDFIDTAPKKRPEMGFCARGADEVPVARLHHNLQECDRRLESMITGITPAGVGTRLFAVQLQTRVQSFALALDAAAHNGRITAEEVPAVISEALQLKTMAGCGLVAMHDEQLLAQLLH